MSFPSGLDIQRGQRNHFNPENHMDTNHPFDKLYRGAFSLTDHLIGCDDCRLISSTLGARVDFCNEARLFYDAWIQALIVKKSQLALPSST